MEGLFNKLDLKTHPNMKMDLKESKQLYKLIREVCRMDWKKDILKNVIQKGGTRKHIWRGYLLSKCLKMIHSII